MMRPLLVAGAITGPLFVLVAFARMLARLALIG